MFSAFSPLNGGNLQTYQYATESPFDLDAGLDYTRLPSAFAPFPFPVVLGFAEGFAPLVDNLMLQTMRGREAFGPWSGQVAAPAAMQFPNLMGSLAKVGG